MSDETIDNSTPAPDADRPKTKRKPAKKAKATKKPAAAKKAAKPKAERANKKAEVIALMKRALLPLGTVWRTSVERHVARDRESRFAKSPFLPNVNRKDSRLDSPVEKYNHRSPWMHGSNHQLAFSPSLESAQFARGGVYQPDLQCTSDRRAVESVGISALPPQSV